MSESGDEYDENEPDNQPDRDISEEYDPDEDYNWKDDYDPDEDYDWKDDYDPDEDYDWKDDYDPNEDYDWKDVFDSNEDNDSDKNEDEFDSEEDDEWDYSDDNYTPSERDGNHEYNYNKGGAGTNVIPKEETPEELSEDNYDHLPEEQSDPEIVPEEENPEDLAGDDIPEIPVPEGTFEFPEQEPIDDQEQEPDLEDVPEWVPPEELAGDDTPKIQVPEDTFEPAEPEQEPNFDDQELEPDSEYVPEWVPPEELAGDDTPEIQVPEDTFEPVEPEQEPDFEDVPEWVPPEELAGDDIPEIQVPEETFEPVEPELKPIDDQEVEPDSEYAPDWVPPEELAGDDIPEISVPDDTFEFLEPELEPIDNQANEDLNAAKKEFEKEQSNDNVHEYPSEQSPDTLQKRNDILIMNNSFYSSHNDTDSFRDFKPKEEGKDQKKPERQLPRKTRKTQSDRKNSESNRGSINRQKSGQGTVLVLKPEIKEKKTESKKKKKTVKNERDEKETQKENEDDVPEEPKEKYKRETGKRAVYAGKNTKGFDEWLKIQKKSETEKEKDKEIKQKRELKEDWELLLEKWIKEADEKVIPKEIKKELLEKIRKYRRLRDLSRQLFSLLRKENLTERETNEMETLIQQIKNMEPIREEIFKNLRAFKNFYEENIKWFEYRIEAERDKFTKFLAQKLKLLKDVENNFKSKVFKNNIEKNWKEILKENLYRNTTLSLNEKSIINKIILKEKLDKEDKEELIVILCKLPTNDLISLLGKGFERHTKNYVRWGWDYDRHLKRLMLEKYFTIYENQKTTINDENVYNFLTYKFLISLKKTVESILGYKKRRDLFSTEFLGQSKKHYEYVKYKSKSDPRFLLLRHVFTMYKDTLRVKLGKEFKKVKPLLDNYIGLLVKLPTRRFKIYKFHPDIDLDYFKVIDSVEKAYWFGFLLADGSLFISKGDKYLSIEVNVKDGILLKNFIHAIGFNPKYVKYYKKIKYNDKGQKKIKRTFRVRFVSEDFARNLINNGFILGKKSGKIRFPALKKREYILACLLGFFDGDGSHVGTPTIYTRSDAFLEDVKHNLEALGYLNDFKIKQKEDKRIKTQGNNIIYYLGLSGEVFNEMLNVFSNSLPRKRRTYLIGKSLKNFQRNQWAKYLAHIPRKTKLKFSKDELSNLRKTLSYKEIAQLHYDKFGVKISLHTIRYWCLKWNIQGTIKVKKTKD